MDDAVITSKGKSWYDDRWQYTSAELGNGKKVGTGVEGRGCATCLKGKGEGTRVTWLHNFEGKKMIYREFWEPKPPEVLGSPWADAKTRASGDARYRIINRPLGVNTEIQKEPHLFQYMEYCDINLLNI